MRKLIGSLVVAAASAAVIAVAGGIGFPTRVAGQQSQMPRTADGKPDLNGIWQTMNTANWNLEDHSGRAPTVPAMGAAGAIPAGRSVVEGGDIPYKKEALAKRKQNGDNWLKEDPEVKCYMPGVPRAMYLPMPFQIVQSNNFILMAFEYAGVTRPIYMTKVEAPPIDTWMGHSLGRWEGDTLVIQSDTFNDSTWFDRAGNYHSEDLKVTERITPITKDALNYEATIDDPKTFTRPWKISMPLYRHLEPRAEIMEFNCVEFVEETLWGNLKKKPAK
jgi:hypothetical protein